MRMDEGTVYAGTIARTFDILYPDAGAFKYDRDLEKEKIKKHVKRLSHALIAEPDKNVLYLNLRNYQVDEKAEFFASWIRLLHEDIKGVNRKLFDNMKKMDWSIDMNEVLAYYLDFVCKEGREYIKNRINRMYIEMGEGCNKIKSIVRIAERGTKDVYMKMCKEFPENYLKKTNDSFLEQILCLSKAEALITYFFQQIYIYHIADNRNFAKEERIEKLQFIEKQLDAYRVDICLEQKEKDIFKDFAIKLSYLNRRKELETARKILECLVRQVEDGFSMEIDKPYAFERYLIEIPETGFDYILDLFNKIKNMEKLKDILEDGALTSECVNRRLEAALEVTEGAKYQTVVGMKRTQELILESNCCLTPKRFREKLEESWENCVFLHKYAGRIIAPFYLQHIKNVYREILMDKTKYAGITARTIMQVAREDLKREGSTYTFGRTEESEFVLAKVSRGFMRERDIGWLFIPKSNLEQVYYKKILEIYQIPSIQKAITELHRFNDYLHETMEAVFDK